MARRIVSAGTAPFHHPEGGNRYAATALAADLRDLGDEATCLRNIVVRLPQQDATVSVKHISGSADRLDSIVRSLAASSATPSTVTGISAAAHAEALADISRRIRSWGSLALLCQVEA